MKIPITFFDLGYTIIFLSTSSFIKIKIPIEDIIIINNAPKTQNISLPTKNTVLNFILRHLYNLPPQLY